MEKYFILPEITGFYGALCALLIMFLAYRVTALRRRYLIGIGGGDNKALDLAIRCHGNAVEYVPIALILLLLIELQGASPILLHVAGIALVVSRGLHAMGLSKSEGKSFGRFFGTFFSWFTIISLSLYLIGTYLLSIFS